MQGAAIAKVEEFKCLVSTVQINGSQVRWRKDWSRVEWIETNVRVICDRRMVASVKERVHKTVARPAMMYGLNTVALTNRQEADAKMSRL